MELYGKRIALLSEDRYQVLELWYTLLRLREAGSDISVVGRKEKHIHVSGRGTRLPLISVLIMFGRANTMLWSPGRVCT